MLIRSRSRLAVLFLSALIGGCTTGDPGTITVVVEGVTGAQGLILLNEARVAEDGRQAAFSCTAIDADPFSTTEVLLELTGNDPCTLGGAILLDPGLYDITTVTIAGGSQTPTSCATDQVEVDGDVEIEMPALGACE